MARRHRKGRISDPWERARQLCDLSHGDIGRAQLLGLTPQGLLRNVPGPGQTWKRPVREWIQRLWEARPGAARRSSRPGQHRSPRPSSPKPSRPPQAPIAAPER